MYTTDPQRKTFRPLKMRSSKNRFSTFLYGDSVVYLSFDGTQKIDEQSSTLFWKFFINHETNTQIYGSLSIPHNPYASQSKPALSPYCVAYVLKYYFIMCCLSSFASLAYITQFKKLCLSIFISGTCHIQQ
jgi:hypothetical protein